MSEFIPTWQNVYQEKVLRTMKKACVLLMVMILISVLSGCGSSAENEEQSSHEAVAANALNGSSGQDDELEATATPLVESDGTFTVTAITILGTLDDNKGVAVQGQFSGMMKSTGYGASQWFLDGEVVNLALGEGSDLVVFGDEMSLITGESFAISTVMYEGKEYAIKIAKGVEFECVLEGDEVRLLLPDAQ